MNYIETQAAIKTLQHDADYHQKRVAQLTQKNEQLSDRLQRVETIIIVCAIMSGIAMVSAILTMALS